MFRDTADGGDAASNFGERFVDQSEAFKSNEQVHEVV